MGSFVYYIILNDESRNSFYFNQYIIYLTILTKTIITLKVEQVKKSGMKYKLNIIHINNQI